MNKTPDEALKDGLENNREDEVSMALVAGADPEKTESRIQLSPLMKAVQKKNVKMMARILEAGADINQQDNEGNTALMLAIDNEYYPAVAYLIAKKADVNKTNHQGETPLMHAAETGEFVGSLLDAGADITKQDALGETALMKAALFNNAGAVADLCFKGADLEVRDLNGNTALILAAENNAVHSVFSLIRKGADVNAVNLNHETAIMKAVQQKDGEKMAGFLCLHEADLSIRDKSGRTVFDYIPTKRVRDAIRDNQFLNNDRYHYFESMHKPIQKQIEKQMSRKMFSVQREK